VWDGYSKFCHLGGKLGSQELEEKIEIQLQVDLRRNSQTKKISGDSVEGKSKKKKLNNKKSKKIDRRFRRHSGGVFREAPKQNAHGLFDIKELIKCLSGQTVEEKLDTLKNHPVIGIDTGNIWGFRGFAMRLLEWTKNEDGTFTLHFSHKNIRVSGYRFQRGKKTFFHSLYSLFSKESLSVARKHREEAGTEKRSVILSELESRLRNPAIAKGEYKYMDVNSDILIQKSIEEETRVFGKAFRERREEIEEDQEFQSLQLVKKIQMVCTQWGCGDPIIVVGKDGMRGQASRGAANFPHEIMMKVLLGFFLVCYVNEYLTSKSCSLCNHKMVSVDFIA